MLIRRFAVAPLACALLLLFAASPALAQFYSTPTRDVENPARTPVQVTETITLQPNIAGTFNVPFVALPVDTRLVLEYASVLCTGPSAGAPIITSLTVTPFGGSQIQFQLPLRSQGTTASGTAVHVATTPIRLYADPDESNNDTAVSGTVVRRAASGTTSCVFSLSGYTIDL